MIGLGGSTMKEIIFEVREDEADGGYTASALGYGIHTEGETIEELRRNVKEATECFFDRTEGIPAIIRLHFVRDEVLAV
jgi:predicted RNase H-like HicB family nuclease